MHFTDLIARQKAEGKASSAEEALVPEKPVKKPVPSDDEDGGRPFAPVYTYKLLPKGGLVPAPREAKAPRRPGAVLKAPPKGRRGATAVGGSAAGRNKARATMTSSATQATQAEPETPLPGPELSSSGQSELSSNLSYQYARERSRQALCPLAARSCMQRVFDHWDELEDERIRLLHYTERPLAAHYVDKVLERLRRTLAGDVLGDMVESELEDLQVDHSFEELRERVEGLSDTSYDPNVFTDYAPDEEEAFLPLESMMRQVPLQALQVGVVEGADLEQVYADGAEGLGAHHRSQQLTIAHGLLTASKEADPLGRGGGDAIDEQYIQELVADGRERRGYVTRKDQAVQMDAMLLAEQGRILEL